MAKKRTPSKLGSSKNQTDLLPKGYAELLRWIKERIRSLPPAMRGTLPSPEVLEAELTKGTAGGD
jgi:hypothetical protein